MYCFDTKKFSYSNKNRADKELKVLLFNQIMSIGNTN